MFFYVEEVEDVDDSNDATDYTKPRFGRRRKRNKFGSSVRIKEVAKKAGEQIICFK